MLHDDGRREMYHCDQEDEDEYLANITLTDSEARQIAAILGGIIYKPKALETIEVAFDDLIIEWFKVAKQAAAVNRSIGELDIRQSYGVTIIAIIKKNHQKLLNPGPETLIEEGDTLVVSGERETLKKLIADLLEKGDSR